MYIRKKKSYFDHKMSSWQHQVSNIFQTLKDPLLGDNLSFQPAMQPRPQPSKLASLHRQKARRRTHEAKQDGQIEWLISYVLSSAKLVPLSLSQTIKAKALRRCRTLYQVDIEF